MCTQLVISANGKPSLTLGTLYAMSSTPSSYLSLHYMHLFLLLSLATPSLLYILLSRYMLVSFTVLFVQSHFRALFSWQYDENISCLFLQKFNPSFGFIALYLVNVAFCMSFKIRWWGVRGKKPKTFSRFVKHLAKKKKNPEMNIYGQMFVWHASWRMHR